MPKLSKWHDMKKTMPLLQKTCLIQTGEYSYRIATLESEFDKKGGYVTPVKDVQRWAYMDLK